MPHLCLAGPSSCHDAQECMKSGCAAWREGRVAFSGVQPQRPEQCQPLADEGQPPVIDFVEALTLVKEGYDTWATKPHNKTWVRRLDGTPIPNDLCVCIAEELVRSLAPREQPHDAAIEIWGKS